MDNYVKRACSSCGIKLQQPHMRQVLVTPKSVNGKELAPRMKWFCFTCKAPHELEAIRHENENLRLKDLREKELEKNRASKRLWAEEQERRRLQNIENKKSF